MALRQLGISLAVIGLASFLFASCNTNRQCTFDSDCGYAGICVQGSCLEWRPTLWDGGSPPDGGRLPDGGSPLDDGGLHDGGSPPDGGSLPDGGSTEPRCQELEQQARAFVEQNNFCAEHSQCRAISNGGCGLGMGCATYVNFAADTNDFQAMVNEWLNRQCGPLCNCDVGSAPEPICFNMTCKPKGDCGCPRTTCENPVCGMNGIPYCSECELLCDGQLLSWHGECGARPPCKSDDECPFGAFCELGLGLCVESPCIMMSCRPCDPLRGRCFSNECQTNQDCKLIYSSCGCQAVPVGDQRSALDPCTYEGCQACFTNHCHQRGVKAICDYGMCTEVL